MGDIEFDGTQEEWDALVKKNKSKSMTAVDWLITELNQELNYTQITQWDRIKDLIKRTKKMERKQIIDAFKFGEYPPPFFYYNAEQYYNETYRSGAVGEKGGAVNKGSDETNGNNVEKVPNVLDDAFNQELFNYFSQEFNINLLGTEMHDIIDIVKRHTSSQTEISDEEIEKEANRMNGVSSIAFEEGAKWYREQLKSK